MPSPEPPPAAYYRMAAPVAARFVGSFLVVAALTMFGSTALVAFGGLPIDLLLVPLLLTLVGVFTLGWWLRNRAWVLRLDAQGYAVRLVRGARTTDAAWSEVREVATASPRGIPCLVLSLHGDRDTVIPVQAVAGDREDLVREVRRRLAASRS